MSNESKCPGHNRAECVSCCWPRRDTDSQWTPAEQEALALGEKSIAPLELNKIGAGYTAVDMTTAAAQGFRDGAASVVVELPPVHADAYDPLAEVAYAERCREAIIAAGGRVKE